MKHLLGNWGAYLYGNFTTGCLRHSKNINYYRNDTLSAVVEGNLNVNSLLTWVISLYRAIYWLD